jgi:hypothetical protein
MEKEVTILMAGRLAALCESRAPVEGNNTTIGLALNY